MKPETTYSAIIGRILAQKRKDLGFDQAKMAKEAGLNRSSWSRLENGELVPDAVQLAQIAHTFQINPSIILAEADAASTELKNAGVTVHMKKPVKDSGVGLGLALIGAAALGGLVAHALSKDNKVPDKPLLSPKKSGGN